MCHGDSSSQFTAIFNVINEQRRIVQISNNILEFCVYIYAEEEMYKIFGVILKRDFARPFNAKTKRERRAPNNNSS